MQGSWRAHEALKERIVREPELVGISSERVLSVVTEFPLMRRRRTVARPDVVFVYRSSGGVSKKFVEVKSGSCRRARAVLSAQVRKISQYLKCHRLDGEVVGVYPAEAGLCVLHHLK